jgi:hypothetical protein
MLCRAALVAAAVVLAGTTASTAQGLSMQGTPEDQRACKPAVMRLCRAALPDTFRILACLQQRRARIGKACQAVLAKYGQ